MTLAAEAPDLDIVGQFHGPVFGFEHHRGFTHSFLGLILMSAIVVGFMYLVWRLRGRRTNDPKLPPRWGWLFVSAYIAGLSHILLDFTNNYGVRPFWPFSERWYSWDIVFIVEPLLYLFLVLGLVLPSFFALINEEIGARQRGPKGRLAAIVALICVALLYGLRDYEHRRAVHALEARTYQEQIPLRASAYPTWFNPFLWYGVVETQNFFALAPINSLTPEVDPGGQLEIRYKPEETPATLAAKKSYLGQVYLDWAQYPITETEDQAEGYLVRFQDLRYAYAWKGTRRVPLAAAVQLDEHLRVIAQIFGQRKQPTN